MTATKPVPTNVMSKEPLVVAPLAIVDDMAGGHIGNAKLTSQRGGTVHGIAVNMAAAHLFDIFRRKFAVVMVIMSASLHDLKVFNSIVGPISVPMMNDFSRTQGAS